MDIFLRDERMLYHLSPRLNDAVGALSVDYVEESTAVRIYFPEGEVAFIAGGPLTSDPLRGEWILGRPVRVDTSAEILARKLWHRAASFPARDLFDFAAVAAFEPDAVRSIGGVLRARRAALLERLREHGEALREDFAALHAWEFHPSFEECAATLRIALSRSSPPPILEQERCPYNATSFAGLAEVAHNPRIGTAGDSHDQGRDLAGRASRRLQSVLREGRRAHCAQQQGEGLVPPFPSLPIDGEIISGLPRLRDRSCGAAQARRGRCAREHAVADTGGG